jgi:hypothetical protein
MMHHRYRLWCGRPDFCPEDCALIVAGMEMFFQYYFAVLHKQDKSCEAENEYEPIETLYCGSERRGMSAMSDYEASQNKQAELGQQVDDARWLRRNQYFSQNGAIYRKGGKALIKIQPANKIREKGPDEEEQCEPQGNNVDECEVEDQHIFGYPVAQGIEEAADRGGNPEFPGQVTVQAVQEQRYKQERQAQQPL